MQLHTYINFEGNAKEAVEFYAKVLKTEAPKFLKFGDLPPNPNFPIDEKFKDYVMHTEINIQGSAIKISDVLPPMKTTKGNNISVVLSFDNAEEITQVYNGLSEGGNIIMPLEKTMWAELYAYFVDKFGTPWQLNFFG